MREQLINNTSGTLAASVTAAETQLTVTGDGSQFPAAGNFVLIGQSNELMLCTARSGAILTVTRGTEGTTATSHASGDTITAIVSSGTFQRYGRDNDPYFDGTRVPFALLAADGSTLTAASFTAHNDSGDAHAAVVTDSDRRVTIKRPAGSGGANESLTLLSRPAPSTPYMVTMCLQPSVVAATYQYAPAVGFREAATGKSLVLRLPMFTGAQDEMYIDTATDETALSLVATIGYCPPTNVLWFGLSDDGTNLTFSFSVDGVNWISLYTAARTANFTAAPDQVVWGCGAKVNVNDAYCTLLSWSE